jgi:hypothetical protein
MSRHLPAAELRKLAKVLGRLGSNADGEVLVAARKADELVRNLGATWDQIIAPSHAPLIAPPPATVAAKIALLRQHIDLLTDWEVNFLASLSRFHKFSPKQLAVIDRLAAEINEGRRAV